jgi:hypothetical protein
MTICCVWTPGETCEDEPNPHRCAYWLGLTTEGKFVYKATSNGCPASAVEVESTVSVAPGVWYRVVAQFAAGTQGNELRLGVGAGSSGLTWVTVGFAGAGIFGVASGETGIPFHVGGWTADYVWRGSMSHGYYYKAALGTTAIDALAGAGKQPINYVDMAEAEDVDTANVESVWQLDEPSTQYAYDQLGSNNLHWGYWHVGSAPGPTGGFPGIRLVRTFYQGKPTNCQYFTCNALASQFSGVNKPMSVFILMRIVNSEATSDPNGFIGLGNTGSNMPYRMWHNTAAYHRDSSNAYAQVQLYQGEGDWAEDTNPSGPTTYTKWAYDAAAHVLCCTWGGSPYSVNFYPDGPLGADTGTMAGVGSVTFNEFSIGAIARATDDVIFPMDGYIGMVVLVPRVISSVERWSLMEWMKRTAGVY